MVDRGIEGDAHAGPWHRQVSFLAGETIEEVRGRGLDVDFGDFAENIATEGVDWDRVEVGTRIRLGHQAVLEITQKGKTCHHRCAIYYRVGDCVMPREGVFARVIKGGKICCGDPIRFVGNKTFEIHSADTQESQHHNSIENPNRRR